MEQIDLWLKQATNLGLWQALFLVVMCLLLAGLAMSIDHWDGEE